MNQDELNYQNAKHDAESMNLSSDWSITDGLGGMVKIAHKCGMYLIGCRNSGYTAVQGEAAIASSMAIRDAVKFIEKIVAPREWNTAVAGPEEIETPDFVVIEDGPADIEAKKVTDKVVKPKAAPKDSGKSPVKAPKSARKPKKTKGR